MAVTTLRVKVGDLWYTVQVADLTHSPVEVTVDGETLYVEIEGLTPPPPTRPTRGPPSSSATSRPAPRVSTARTQTSDNILRSPMPGRVISIPVRPGDRVSEGDEVCVIEAMKMEQSVRAFRDGIVKTVYVQPLDSVHANDPLVELE